MTNAAIDVDVAILGAGAAGLSLLAHLGASGWRGTVALVDDGSHPLDSRSWAWWSTGELLLDPYATTELRRARVAGQTWQRTVDLDPFVYRAMAGARLRSACEELAGAGLAGAGIEVTRVVGAADAVTAGPPTVVRVVGASGNATAVRAGHVFDSVGVGSDRAERARRPHLDFLGWVVSCESDIFDPELLVLMDFRTDQSAGVAFMYVLPLSARVALVERTVFRAGRGVDLPPPDHAPHLEAYLKNHLEAHGAAVIGKEQGIIPLATPTGAVAGATAIGTPSGAVKASTGYAFARIQRHSAALAAELVGAEARARSAASSPWFRRLDNALLILMAERPAHARKVLEALLRRISAPDLLRFLDEDLSLPRQVGIFVRLPAWYFVWAGLIHDCRRLRAHFR